MNDRETGTASNSDNEQMRTFRCIHCGTIETAELYADLPKDDCSEFDLHIYETTDAPTTDSDRSGGGA